MILRCIISYRRHSREVINLCKMGPTHLTIEIGYFHWNEFTLFPLGLIKVFPQSHKESLPRGNNCVSKYCLSVLRYFGEYNLQLTWLLVIWAWFHVQSYFDGRIWRNSNHASLDRWQKWFKACLRNYQTKWDVQKTLCIIVFSLWLVLLKITNWYMIQTMRLSRTW